jgi:hypothetical protein
MGNSVPKTIPSNWTRFRYATCAAGRRQGEKLITDGGEKSGRQHVIGNRACITVWRAPHIRPRPDEFIPLGKHHPRALGIEPQPCFDRRRNLHRERGLRWQAVRDGQHEDARFAGIFSQAPRRDNRAGTVFLPFLAAGQVLAVPEIAVTNDEAGNRSGHWHVTLFQFGIEGGEFVRHLGAAHGLDPLLRKVFGQPDPPIPPLEAGIFLGREQHEIVAAVLW